MTQFAIALALVGVSLWFGAFILEGIGGLMAALERGKLKNELKRAEQVSVELREEIERLRADRRRIFDQMPVEEQLFIMDAAAAYLDASACD